MSIQTEINRLNTEKTDILNSIKNKGVDTSSAETLSDVSSLIDNITTKEDLDAELTEQSTLLSNQGVTIDDIKLALQGKTAGGGSSNVVSGSFIPTENYTSADQYFEVDLGFKPSEVIVYRKSWVKGAASINVTFRSDYMGVSVTNTASSGKANEKMVGSSYITISDTGFKVIGNSTYYLVGGSEYIYVAVKEVGVV